MRIINIVDNIKQVNFGIWSAAIITSPWLRSHGQAESHIWFPASSAPSALPDLYGAQPRALADTASTAIPAIIKAMGLSNTDTVICTHGSWRYATWWGYAFKKFGYKWVYVPQGMLESWSMAQKSIKKWIYFNLVEARLARHADVVRAVSLPEFNTLSTYFSNVSLISNAVSLHQIDMARRQQNTINTVLYMARLHHKKGVIPLVQAWLQSPLALKQDWQLRIAGPDDGELEKLTPLLAQAKNVAYLGAIYGAQKLHELENAHYYILPTRSEGFPTSVVEAMQAGLIPAISDGANFPEVFGAGLGIKISQEVDDIAQGLATMEAMPANKRLELSGGCARFIENGYLLNQIGPMQLELFRRLLGRDKYGHSGSPREGGSAHRRDAAT